jgi:hypothetical protein
LCPQATLPKLASQFFGAGFGRPWVVPKFWQESMKKISSDSLAAK